MTVRIDFKTSVMSECSYVCCVHCGYLYNVWLVVCYSVSVISVNLNTFVPIQWICLADTTAGYFN